VVYADMIQNQKTFVGHFLIRSAPHPRSVRGGRERYFGGFFLQKRRCIESVLETCG
jgi:hypothetical protein